MSRLSSFQRDLRGYVLLLAGLALSAYFSYHVVYGERSYGRLHQLSGVAAQKEQDLAQVTAQREDLERNVKMLRPETLSPDFLEERARAVLGYKSPDEYVIFRN